MDEFLILMRLDLITREAQPSPEQMQVYMQQYHDWVGGIAARNQFVGGTSLSFEGKVIRHDHVIMDGPYAETKESLAGFVIIKAKDLEEAAGFAKDCPILAGAGNSVEVRKITGGHQKPGA